MSSAQAALGGFRRVARAPRGRGPRAVGHGALGELSLTEQQVLRVLGTEQRALGAGAVRRCCPWPLRWRVGSAFRTLAARELVLPAGAAGRYVAADEWWLRARPRGPRHTFPNDEE